MMVTIMLLTDLHPFVEPLTFPERYYVIAGEDATIQDLADRSLGPVAMVDEEATCTGFNCYWGSHSNFC